MGRRHHPGSSSAPEKQVGGDSAGLCKGRLGRETFGAAMVTLPQPLLWASQPGSVGGVSRETEARRAVGAMLFGSSRGASRYPL